MRTSRLLALVVLASALGGCELSDRVKPGAQSLLEIFSEPSAFDSAQDAINPYDADRRYRGTLQLAKAPYAGEDVYMRLFTDGLKDPDEGVRAASLRALALHGEAEHALLLADAIKDEEPLVRTEAAKGLQRLHNPRVVDDLLAALREPDPAKPELVGEEDADVRAQAARALGQYREDRVVQGLMAALLDSRLVVNRAALDSLRVLTGQDFGLDQRAWVAWYGRSDRAFAAGRMYVYPIFERPRTLIEHLPFVPQPPNEQAGTPAGMPMTPIAP